MQKIIRKTLKGAEAAAQREFQKDQTPHDIYTGHRADGTWTPWYTILPAGQRNRGLEGYAQLHEQKLIATMDTEGNITRK